MTTPGALRASLCVAAVCALSMAAACRSSNAATDSKAPPADALSAKDAVAKFKSDPAGMKGTRIKVWGDYNNYTPQGDLLNVPAKTPDPGVAGPVCQFPASAKAELDKLKPGRIVFSGVVDGEFFGAPLMKDCKLE